MDLFDGLNPPQREAVEHIEGPLLIMAGAGSGKTRVLTCRIANLIRHGVYPYNILAITFTNKAATEMLERVNALVGNVAKNICFTFHSFCARLLRREIEVIGTYDKNFTIYDAGDSLSVVKTCLKELNLDVKQFSPNSIRNQISSAKNLLQDAEKFAAQVGKNPHDKCVAEVYKLYQKKLRENNALDFDDLLAVAVKLLKEHTEVREKYQERFKYILVDEYQDTNGAQYQITKLLAAKYKNLCVVGDADQSIYGWRGADMHNILDFEKDYPEAKVIKLEENYRSTGLILQAANNVIKHNVERHPKNLWTKKPDGEPITYFTANSEWDEANYVADTIEENVREGRYGYSDMAILYRTNAQSRVFEDTFMQRGLPYTIVGALKFYERKEIKDVLAYLRLIVNPRDDVSLLRIINVPRRGLGTTTMARLMAFAAEREESLFDVMSDEELLNAVDGLSKRACNSLENFVELMFKFMGDFAGQPLDKIIEDVLEGTGYLKELEQDEKDGPGRLENLKEFVGVAKEFQNLQTEATLSEFLAHLALLTDLDNTDMADDRVTMMTFHASKGLEFPVVFMVGMEEGLFPGSRSFLELSEMEEERRTCYVGITRAQNKLYLTNTYERTIYGKTSITEPSRFIGEIGEDCIETEGRPRRRNTAHGTRRTSTATEKFVANAPSGVKSWESSPRTSRPTAPKSAPPKSESLIKPNLSATWQVGDKAKHNKWDIGTIVEIKGQGEDTQLTVAFPNVGLKKMMQKYAPITKVNA